MPDEHDTYYNILKIDETASDERIKEAYRSLVKDYHPDLVPSHLSKIQHDVQEKFKQINEAYEILSSPDKRREYNNALTDLRKGEQKSTSYNNQPDSQPTSPSFPQLYVNKRTFGFLNIRKNSLVSDSFTISNVGSGVLSGLIRTDKKWLKVSQNNIDTTKHKQDIAFHVNTFVLTFGFSDAGAIEILSNGGMESVNVTISIEAAPKRRNKFIAAGVGISVLIFVIVPIIVSNVGRKNDKHSQSTVSKVETYDKQIWKKPEETPVAIENPFLHRRDHQESMPDQSKNQDNYKPETAIPAPQSTVSKQLYADKVDYYDYGLVDKAFVEKFLASEVKAQPYRKDKLTSSIKIIPGNIDNEKTAKFTGHFIYGNDKTTIEGDYNSEITLRKQKDHIVIVREKGKIENQQTKDTPVPKVAIPAQQFSLTDALRKRPWVVINTRERFDHRSARMEFMNNGVIIVYTDEYPRNRGFFRMNLNFSWSPSESAYIGTWGSSYNNVCGRIKLWPQYDSHGNIKCFSGYMGNGSGSHDAIIKVKNFFCRCRDPSA